MGFLQKLFGGMPGTDDHGTESAGKADDHDHDHDHAEADHSHDEPASDDVTA